MYNNDSAMLYEKYASGSKNNTGYTLDIVSNPTRRFIQREWSNCARDDPVLDYFYIRHELGDIDF